MPFKHKNTDSTSNNQIGRNTKISNILTNSITVNQNAPNRSSAHAHHARAPRAHPLPALRSRSAPRTTSMQNMAHPDLIIANLANYSLLSRPPFHDRLRPIHTQPLHHIRLPIPLNTGSPSLRRRSRLSGPQILANNTAGSFRNNDRCT